jgi:hypothetical protein
VVTACSYNICYALGLVGNAILVTTVLQYMYVHRGLDAIALMFRKVSGHWCAASGHTIKGYCIVVHGCRQLCKQLLGALACAWKKASVDINANKPEQAFTRWLQALPLA